LTCEFVNFETLKGNDIEVWDCSLVGENGLKTLVKRLLGRNKFRNNCKKYLRSKDNVTFVEHKSRREFLTPTNYATELLLDYSELDENSHNIIYNTIVEKVGALKIQIKKHKKIINREMHMAEMLSVTLNKKTLHSSDTVVTVNGRFTKNRLVKHWAKQNDNSCLLIEFGRNANSFEVYTRSPHSVLEMTDQTAKYWSESSYLERDNIAKNYLDDLYNKKTYNKDWRLRIMDNAIPTFSTKKACVFFASTEIEAAGVSDPSPEGSFQNQVEAFNAVVKTLPKEVWTIFLRLHPPGGDVKKFNTFRANEWKLEEWTENVQVIEPMSQVDSIALGMKADLVINFWSTIAVELMIRGHANVLTLGQSNWNYLVPEKYVPDVSSLRRYLTLEHCPVDPVRIYPWAYYLATFGVNFKVFVFDVKLKKWKFQFIKP
jgi:hypothetical protein